MLMLGVIVTGRLTTLRSIQCGLMVSRHRLLVLNAIGHPDRVQILQWQAGN